MHRPRLAAAGWTAALVVGVAAPGPLTAQEAGAIAGTVSVRLPPPRRSAARYPGGAPAPHEVQQVPAVVYVRGRVEGAAPGPPATTPTVAQRDTAFLPPALVIEVGTTVRFPNEDTFFHNVFSYSAPARFDLGRYPRGEAKDVTFDRPGVVKVYCEVHEFMRAVIVVTENPLHAVVGADGAFRLDRVPPGTYTVVFWHPDVDPVERSVRVEPGATARVAVELR